MPFMVDKSVGLSCMLQRTAKPQPRGGH